MDSARTGDASEAAPKNLAPGLADFAAKSKPYFAIASL